MDCILEASGQASLPFNAPIPCTGCVPVFFGDQDLISLLAPVIIQQYSVYMYERVEEGMAPCNLNLCKRLA